MTPPATMPATMNEFAIRKTTSLLDDVAAAMLHAADSPEEESVHKMRVAIRRFQQALRLFQQYLSDRGIKKVKKRLREIMDVAGELRNRDIALSLIGAPDPHFLEQRAHLKEELTTVLRAHATPDVAARWRELLGLPQ